MVSFYILLGIFLWFVCGTFTIAFLTAQGEYLSVNEKRVAVAAGPVGFFGCLGWLLWLLFLIPAKWASIIGCRVGGYVRDKTR